MKGVLFVFSVLLIAHSSCYLNVNLESYFNGECLRKTEPLFNKNFPECSHTIDIYHMYKAFNSNFYFDDFMAAHQLFVTLNLKEFEFEKYLLLFI